MKPILCISFASAALIAAGCATSPLGRSQLKLVSDDQMAQMGVAAFRDMQKKVPRSIDERQNRYVTCVANAITNEIQEQRTWEVEVFNDKQVNAFALPGGKIGVYSGLLKVAVTQDQLAAVIGHEVSHVLAGHSSERMSQQMVGDVGTTVVSAATGVDAQALGVAANVFFLLPFSRTQETEADLLGLDLMSMAGFNPEGAIALWQNMSHAGGEHPPEMLSTHPADQSRIRELNNRLPKARQLYQHARESGLRPGCSA
ncbi:MAG TPA: M48 family metallopeptidase [Nevskiaceae bacterium]|nr:M48 family metallopeptidase [Nevskiaceae bacterium]